MGLKILAIEFSYKKNLELNKLKRFYRIRSFNRKNIGWRRQMTHINPSFGRDEEQLTAQIENKYFFNIYFIGFDVDEIFCRVWIYT